MSRSHERIPAMIAAGRVERWKSPPAPSPTGPLALGGTRRWSAASLRTADESAAAWAADTRSRSRCVICTLPASLLHSTSRISCRGSKPWARRATEDVAAAASATSSPSMAARCRSPATSTAARDGTGASSSSSSGRRARQARSSCAITRACLGATGDESAAEIFPPGRTMERVIAQRCAGDANSSAFTLSPVSTASSTQSRLGAGMAAGEAVPRDDSSSGGRASADVADVAEPPEEVRLWRSSCVAAGTAAGGGVRGAVGSAGLGERGPAATAS
mmetsp:Transcript_58049/g.138185  ORF Transcript_58049/g.138185 Transcript_58049/m.138185 type:complete len:275 (+) Transcript_58049:46-870(+)